MPAAVIEGGTDRLCSRKGISTSGGWFPAPLLGSTAFVALWVLPGRVDVEAALLDRVGWGNHPAGNRKLRHGPTYGLLLLRRSPRQAK